MRTLSASALAVLLFTIISGAPTAQQQPLSEVVRPIEPPRTAFPSEPDSAAESRFSFIAYGDTREDQNGFEVQKRHGRVMDMMLSKIKELSSTRYPVRFAIQSGDAVTRGNEPARWGSFVSIIERMTLEGGIPLFFSVGNHDVTGRPQGDPLRLIGLQHTMTAFSKLIPPEDSERRLRGFPTYSVGYGNMFVIALDSNIAEDTAQLAWVTRQLETVDRTRYKHIIATFHHPPLSSGPHGGDLVEPPTATIRRLYMPLFRRHHVAMTITGHEHLLDHYVERYDDGGKTHRMDHIVTGGGGAPTYTFKSEPNLDLYVKMAAPQKTRIEHLLRPSARIDGNPLHFYIIRVDDDKLSLEVVGVDAGPTIYLPYKRPRVELHEGS